jgi:hypothetical protein
MGLLILASSLLLAAAPGDGQTEVVIPEHPPTNSVPATRGRTSSPPTGKPPADPKVNVDPGIQLPANKAPEKPGTPAESDKPTRDSVKPKDDSVKPVAPAPSTPDKPGVRPL